MSYNNCDDCDIMEVINNIVLSEEDYVALLEKCETDLFLEYNRKLVWKIE